MKVLRIYVDTSVVGGCFDKEFQEDSRRLIKAIGDGKFTMLLSAIVYDEIETAPEKVRKLMESIPPRFIEYIEITPEVIALRDAYLAAGIVGKKSLDDATHVACATVARADAIVSWNFRHIVRLEKIRAYNAINLMQGYGVLTIVPPKGI